MFDFFKKCECKNEKLYREVVDATRGSLNIKKTKKTIINVIGKALNADRCFIMEYDKENDRFEILDEEYLSSDTLKSCIGLDLNTHLPHITEELKKGKSIIYNQSETKLDDIRIDLNDGTFELEKKTLEDFKIYSGVVFPIFYAKEFLGDIVIHYVDKAHKAGEDELNLIKVVSEQLAIALYQAKLYRKVKIQNEIQTTILNNIPFMTWLKDRNSRYIAANKKVAEAFNLTPEEIIGKFDSDFTPLDLAQKYREDDLEVMKSKKTKITEEIIMYKGERRWAETFKSPIIDDNGNVLGTTGLAHDITDRKAIEIELLERQQKIVKANERALLLRKIIDNIRSSLDINITTKAIVDEIGLTLNPNICFIVKHDIDKDFFYVDKYTEYRSSDDEESFVGHNSDELKFGWFVNKFRNNVIVTFTNVEEFIIENNLQNTLEEAFLREYSIKSAYLYNIYYADNILGYLIILYTKDYYVLDSDNQELMKTLASQVGTAIYQSELYSKTKRQAERESLLRNITEIIRSSLNIEETLNYICEETAKVFQVERTAITMFPNHQNYEEYILRKEYKKSKDFKGFKEIDNPPKIAAIWGKKLMESDKVYSFDSISSDFPEYLRNEYESIGIKAIIGTGIRKGEIAWGTLVLAEYEQARTWNEEEKKLLKTIADQVYIAINQAELYEEQKLTAKRELLLRNIIETISGTLDINEIKKSIINEIIKVLHPDRVHIIEFNFNEKKYIPINSNSEYRSSNTFSSYVGLDISAMNEFKDIQNLHLSGKDMIYSDIEEYIKENNFEETSIASTLRNLGIKSLAAICIWDEDKFVGNIVIEYLNEAIKFSQDDIEFIKAIKNGTAIAFKQAKLYEAQKLAAERERISRNIIEILRSSIDKTIIKKLFVKNIGKFFNADRVFFSEYNTTEKMYAPVDKDSEYLSNSWEKSFIDFDWSNPDIKEHVQPLLEKREIKIPDWSDYVKKHPNMSEGFRRLYEDAKVKSSYNFPVLYQDKIIGYFCLEFTQSVCGLTEEDIGRIRSICTQAGIAMYHADLYEKAQQCDFSNGVFKSNVIEKIKEPTNNILDISILLSKNEFERTVQIQYLNSIISSCNQLLELTKSI